MWGIFIGIVLGAGQVLALKALVGVIMNTGGIAPKLFAFLLLIIKMALIVLILLLLSRISVAHVIWAAGGMLIGLVGASAAILFRRKKTDNNEHVD